MKDFWMNTKSFVLKCKRVWYVLRKPSKQEYSQVAKISAIGILILGLLGFVVSLAMKIFI